MIPQAMRAGVAAVAAQLFCPEVGGAIGSAWRDGMVALVWFGDSS
jgi:hypothetical protein